MTAPMDIRAYGKIVTPNARKTLEAGPNPGLTF
jgi:hypothetical protein